MVLEDADNGLYPPLEITHLVCNVKCLLPLHGRSSGPSATLSSASFVKSSILKITAIRYLEEFRKLSSHITSNLNILHWKNMLKGYF